jgi:hypothetical protein
MVCIKLDGAIKFDADHNFEAKKNYSKNYSKNVTVSKIVHDTFRVIAGNDIHISNAEARDLGGSVPLVLQPPLVSSVVGL